MKKIFTYIFVTLGVIFLILVIIGAYFFVVDPYQIKPLIFGSSAPVQSGVTDTDNDNDVRINSEGSDVDAGGFQLSEAQKQALISFGIDPALVPSTISAEQEACFVSTLGAVRVIEIKAGAVPSALEFMKAQGCV